MSTTEQIQELERLIMLAQLTIQMLENHQYVNDPNYTEPYSEDHHFRIGPFVVRNMERYEPK